MSKSAGSCCRSCRPDAAGTAIVGLYIRRIRILCWTSVLPDSCWSRSLLCFLYRVFRASFSRGVGFGYLTWGIILIAGGSIWNTAKCRPACNITYVYTSYGVKYTSYYTDTVCSSYCTVVMAALVACGVIFVIVGGILVNNSKKILQTDRQIAPQTVVVVQGYPQYAQQGYPQQEYQQYQTQPAYPQQYAQYPQQQQVAYAPQDQYAQPAYPQQQQVYYSNPPSPLPPKA
ncbi:hypothetical protein BCR33DRAFT_431240 [Rhizoclosmatium globosum]|uniref:Uncharacterized protein n=1 Tax=Rhizoclosmatium globosum TaxID=329046 RepID=A0A1Y2BUJ3_9FUNG|nr:hypothetical protein BCR33DRAFT_431240 [Rhizoclosmatium globosum]|eukprot:ORY38432.1 hypothetical protein BCR33DRAFT_431240 [Rhizoclosmatium globosum]